MEKFIRIKSIAAPLMLPNLDTDIIAPMKRILLNGDEIEKYGFEPLRFVNGDGDAGAPNPEFVLNQEPFRRAKILLCGENFGCGSSRENAPQAIAGMGIRCVIGTTFGGIFFKNCVNQGILPIKVSPADVRELVELSVQGRETEVDLEARRITLATGRSIPFDISDSQRYLLMEGLDNVGLTLKKAAVIRNFEETDRRNRPWVYTTMEQHNV
ncbi:3-isopropylmalate dehydratase small subunit [Desulfitobacterium hafniense]|uniref:3-isopropylmalate dehydratase small subunit n=1 Tax=Desulfitobacterium hafniense TaxID=49338 RepID=UPI0003810F50|nr:3-isopropylmalate dehydratase small subunit [Desulfitobacterium hafniense]